MVHARFDARKRMIAWYKTLPTDTKVQLQRALCRPAQGSRLATTCTRALSIRLLGMVVDVWYTSV